MYVPVSHLNFVQLRQTFATGKENGPKITSSDLASVITPKPDHISDYANAQLSQLCFGLCFILTAPKPAAGQFKRGKK